MSTQPFRNRPFLVSALLVPTLAIWSCGGQQQQQQQTAAKGEAAMENPLTPVASAQTAPSPGARIDALTSAKLNSLSRDIQPALASANKAGSGRRRWSAGADGGQAGASFQMFLYRLGGGGGGDRAEELKRMAAAAFPAPPFGADAGLTVDVQPVGEAERARLGAAFDAWLPDGDAEAKAIAALGERIASAAPSDLELFVVNGARATDRNRGIVAVDPASREAVWIYGRAVRLTVDKRGAD